MIKPQQADQSNSEISKTEVFEDQDRSNVLYNLFGKAHLKAEIYTFQWMETLCKDYHGAYWYIYRLSNGAFYMAPATDKRFAVYCPGSGAEVDLSADAAGLVACLYSVNQLAHETRQDKIIDLYHMIRDYALNHPEVEGIFRAID